MTKRPNAPSPAHSEHAQKREEQLPQKQLTKSKRLDAHWRARFLDVLADTSNVSEASRRAGVNPSRAYKVRREEPAFAQAWLEALWEGYTHLEMEVLRRLRTGDVQNADGHKFDFANAIRLLAAHRDNVAAASARQHNVSAVEIRASIDRKVEEIRRRLMHEKSQDARGDG